MTRTKKILLGLSVFIVLLLVAGYVLGNYLLESYSQRIMEVMAKRGKKHGVLIVDPQFRDAGLTGLRSAQWNGLYAELQFPNSEAFDPEKRFEVRMSHLDGWFDGNGQITVVARNVDIDTTLPPPEDGQSTEETPSSSERVSAKRVQCSFDMQLTDPLPGLEEALPELVRLMRDGSCELPVLASGVLEFELNETTVKVGIKVEMSSEQEDQAYFLVLSSADLHAISDQLEEPLTEAEVELLAANPLRAAQLLRIKNDAESTAERAKAADDAVPQDAYRHVLWSFLLTKKYGAEFAERVTDSHEEGDTGNTPAEREMDYRNNEAGRQYADQKVRRGDILTKIETDPNVVLQAK